MSPTRHHPTLHAVVVVDSVATLPTYWLYQHIGLSYCRAAFLYVAHTA